MLTGLNRVAFVAMARMMETGEPPRAACVASVGFLGRPELVDEAVAVVATKLRGEVMEGMEQWYDGAVSWGRGPWHRLGWLLARSADIPRLTLRRGMQTGHILNSGMGTGHTLEMAEALSGAAFDEWCQSTTWEPLFSGEPA